MRPIDADALQTRFKESYKHLLEIYNSLENNIYKHIYRGEIEFCTETISRINEAPTIDAVPVVRCKDCKYWHMFKEDFYACRNVNGMNNYGDEDGFCSCGERTE